MKRLNKLRVFAASAMASTLILAGAIAHADDTEVFFGGPAIDDSIKPNVFFILDNSGSMAWRLDRDSTPTRDSHGPARMSVLKEAFSEILNTTNGVNIGVMALNSRTDFYQDRLVYPVEYISSALGISSLAPEILASTDDASRIGNTTNVASPTLVMGNINSHANNTVVRGLGSNSSYSNDNSSYYLKGNYSCSVKINTERDHCDTGTKTTLNARSGNSGQTGLFLFRNLNIPAGANIVSATLTITPANTQTNRPALTVALENSKTPAAINDATPVTDRDFSISKTFTNDARPTWSANNPTSIDVKSGLLDALKAIAPANDPIADLALQIPATSDRDYLYYVGDHAQAPVLTVVYSNATNSTRTTGLRFQNVAIPQGATITSARLDFVAAGSDDRPVTFEVAAQIAADAAPFSPTEDFTTRTKTTAVTWSPQEWRTENPPTYLEGPSVVSQVQQVVNNTAWCGNNAMAFFIKPVSGDGSRTTHSVDGSSLRPVLSVTYTGGDDGCLQPVLEARLVGSKNDARQSDGTVTLNSNTLALGQSATVAARFENLPIKRNAQVLESQVIVTRSGTGGSSEVTVHIENSANSPELQARNNNLSERSTYTGPTCSLSGEQTICSGTALNTELQKVFAKSGWNDGNALTVLLKATNKSSNNYTTHAVDGSPAQAIKLRLKLSNGSLGSNVRTVKQHVNGLVQQMNANGGTPIVPALYDAARYLSEKHGDTGVFGKSSPITSACQPTHLVLLTDGKPEGTSSTATSGIADMTGTTCSSEGIGYNDERCARELVRWMASEDQSSFEGDNFITTHTVGFALNARSASESAMIQKFLKDLATEGKGSFYTADDAATLADSFSRIIQEVLATDTTFVSASAAVNTFNRQDNKDEVYFSLFRPSETNRWPGNLKRYQMVAENGRIWLADADKTPAIDANTGFFKSEARSFWSEQKDGSNVAAGGAASRLPAMGSRKLWTNLSTTAGSLGKIEIDNTALTAEKIGASNATERANLISYIRGSDLATPASDRKALGDPLHSTPTLVTYACNEYNELNVCVSEDQAAIIGTNEGFVHLFDTETGAERFAFMPEVLLPNIKQLRENARSTSASPRLYGMDNTVVVWANDANGNGVIYGGKNPSKPDETLTGLNPNEFVYAYATMGRGGSDIYALDITNRDNPTLLWKIQGGVTAGFEHLGQTWSAPVKSKINVGGTDTDVLIFGGGYDPNQDNVDVRTADSRGNALYIVNAKTGALIWSAGSASGHTQPLNGMQYSIPSRVSVIGLQPDEAGKAVVDPKGLAGQIFVGDMGGQVWRFYINNGKTGRELITPAGSGNSGVFADVGGSEPADARRFYHEVELALLSVEGKKTLTVNVGSGYRGHPLNSVIEDGFYSFRTHLVKGEDTEVTLNEGSLYDATNNAAQNDNEAAMAVAKHENGWMIRFTRAGEKVLTRPLIADGMVLFSTYQPQSNANLCKATVGITRAYTVMLDKATGLTADRFVESKASSLPANPQIYCAGNSCWVYHDPSELVPLPDINGGEQDACINSANPEKCRCDRNPSCIWMPPTPRLYWIDEE
ncbi:PilC/PilY family type IV pilus protein [Stutzerimonas stutzeri]|uniref:PilC/PilY family type IV pilus protein n=1 Tax=Stutzerimonas stutzeri TaxID=316 RepID=UPI003D322760